MVVLLNSNQPLFYVLKSIFGVALFYFIFSQGLRLDWLLIQRTTTYLCLTIWRLNTFAPFPRLTFFLFLLILYNISSILPFLLYITLDINLIHMLFYSSLKRIYNFGEIIHCMYLFYFMDLNFHYWIRTIIAYNRSMLF